MIRLWIIIFYLFNVIFLDAKENREGIFRYNKFTYVPIDKIVSLRFGNDTYDSIHQKFGDKIFEELYFGMYALPRKIGENYYPIDRIVGYFGTIADRSYEENQENMIKKIQIRERQGVFLFYYKDRLIDFSVFNEYFLNSNSAKTALGKNATIDIRKKYSGSKSGTAGGWPEAYCDNKYFFYKSGREKEHVETYLAEPCAWEAPDFETKLRNGLYYEHKRAMDQGDYSHLIKTQSGLPKWFECPLPNGAKCK